MDKSIFILNKKKITLMQKEKYKVIAKETIEQIFKQIETIEQKGVRSSRKSSVKYEIKIINLKSKIANMVANYKALETANNKRWYRAKRKFSNNAVHIKNEITKLSDI